jgi:tetratricopeptide (TPR) repeat protein
MGFGVQGLKFKIQSMWKQQIVLMASCIILTANHLVAQKTDYAKIYTEAKTELKNKNFDKAMELFKKASVEAPDNQYLLNSTYFYAYCALKQKLYWSANHYLTKIISKYPEWPKIDEVYYLEAQMSYEKREFSAATNWTRKIKSKFLKRDVDNMKWNFLFYPSLTDTVSNIQKTLPTDTTVANILYELTKDGADWKSRRTAKKLAEEYDLEAKEEPQITTNEVTIKKDTLKIAVLFPFNLSETIKDNVIKNNLYVYDMYTGLRFAYDSLVKMGVKIKLTAYDYGVDSTGFDNLLAKPEMASHDLFIGPFHNSLASRTASFCTQNQIISINPLSNNVKFIEGSAWMYLFKPSAETQNTQAALFAAQYFLPRKAIVLTSRLAKDSLLAVQFEEQYRKLGGIVNTRQTLTAGTLSKLDKILLPKTLDSTGFIYVTSSDQYLGVNIIRKLTEIDKTTPILAPKEWIDFQSVNFTQMQKQNIHFVLPQYVDYTKDTTKSVTQKIQNKTNTPPSEYTFSGIELMWQIGQLWRNKDNLAFPNFLKGLGYQPGFIYKGLDFSQSNDNRNIGVYRFDNSGFAEVKLPNQQ